MVRLVIFQIVCVGSSPISLKLRKKGYNIICLLLKGNYF